MNSLKKRYERVVSQGIDVFKTRDVVARMSTMAAILHHKMSHFSWTGFYMKHEEALVVSAYQGPLACTVLPEGRGVCWDCVERKTPVIVHDVREFPGHIACDERTRSEIVVPVYDANGDIRAVLDVDSMKKGAFNDTDSEGLQKCAELIYKKF
ncbi:MAG: GAF domain-containing protein [bacterium]